MPTYIRLTNYKSSEEKEKGFFDPKNRYEAKQEDFFKIPGSPIAYWVSDRVKEIFERNILIKNFAEAKSGIMTGDDEVFLKYWFEVSLYKIGFNHKSSEDINKYKKKWFPMHKGGTEKKWYGNLEYLVNLENNGFAIRNSGNNFRLRSFNYYFKLGITWSNLTSSNFSARIANKGTLFGSKGPILFLKDNNFILYFLSLLNSKSTNKLLNFRT